MKQKVLSLVLAVVMLSTSVDVTAFASQAIDVDSAVFMEEAADETTQTEEEAEDELLVNSHEESQITSEEAEEELEFSLRGGGKLNFR